MLDERSQGCLQFRRSSWIVEQAQGETVGDGNDSGGRFLRRCVSDAAQHRRQLTQHPIILTDEGFCYPWSVGCFGSKGVPDNRFPASSLIERQRFLDQSHQIVDQALSVGYGIHPLFHPGDHELHSGPQEGFLGRKCLLQRTCRPSCRARHGTDTDCANTGIGDQLEGTRGECFALVFKPLHRIRIHVYSDRMSTPALLAPSRQSRVRWAAALIGGPGELLDFLIPLWAGSALGLSSSHIGALVAVELLVSFSARYPAGVLADLVERRYIAATGAALYALSCAGYALAAGPVPAFLAAAMGGVGGALFWVAARAIVSESISTDSGAYARPLSWQESGSWIAFLAGLTLLDSITYQGVFFVAAAACAAAAVVLTLTTDRLARAAPGAPPSAPPPPASPPPASPGAPAPPSPGRLRPMLIATAVTSMAEAAVGLLLLLHLQQAFALDVIYIALVFLPGAIAAAALPGPAHRLVLRLGRRRVAATAALASAAFAGALAFAPSPLWIAVLWVLSGAAWAAIIPVEQAVIAETAGARAGRGFGMYESASLAGAAAGTLFAGFAYDSISWAAACLIFAAVIAAGAVITPWAIRRSGATDRPPPGNALLSPAVAASAPKTARNQLMDLGWHTALFAAGQLVLAFMNFSWLADLAASEDMAAFLASGGSSDVEGLGNFLYHAGRIWVVVLIVDVVWSVFAAARTKGQRV